MKKLSMILAAALLVSAPAFAVSPEEAQQAKYQEMVKIKQAQREAKEARKQGLAGGAIEKKETFWDREGKRSGFDRFNGQGVGNVFKNMNPVPFFKDQQDRYQARKTASVK